MAVETKRMSWRDTAALLFLVAFPNAIYGLVAPNRWPTRWLGGPRAGATTMRFLQRLRDRYGAAHLWSWFPTRRTLLVLDPATIEAVLRSEDNAADPALKKRALSAFVPDALVTSSGEGWKDRRPFNEAVLDTAAPCPAEHAAFGSIVAQVVDDLAPSLTSPMRWPDFQQLAQAVAQRIIFGAQPLRPQITERMDRMVRRANFLLRDDRAFDDFYADLERDLAGDDLPPTCLLHAAAARVRSGATTSLTRVPSQAGFWCFVLKEAVELHGARTLALIAAHPEVQARARREILAASGRDRLTSEAVQHLDYLESCIREQLRLWTPVPILLRRVVARASLRESIPLAPEQQILIHAAAYHRDPAFFGAHADAFSPGVQHALPTYVFSAHRQRCAGESLLLFVLKATLANLLRRFRFELVGPAISPGRIAYRYNHYDLALRAIPEAPSASR